MSARLSCAVQQPLLDRVDLLDRRRHHRHVVVDDIVEQRVQHVVDAVRQQLGRGLAALPHRRVGLRRAMADADDVVVADEDAGLAEHHLAVLQCGGAQHHEQRIAVDLELGHLVRAQRVLDRQLVQPELRLQDAQVLLGRLVEADPDEVALLARPGGAVAELDLGDPLTAAVGVGGDDPAHAPVSCGPAIHIARSARRVHRGRNLGDRHPVASYNRAVFVPDRASDRLGTLTLQT